MLFPIKPEGGNYAQQIGSVSLRKFRDYVYLTMSNSISIYLIYCSQFVDLTCKNIMERMITFVIGAKKTNEYLIKCRSNASFDMFCMSRLNFMITWPDIGDKVHIF